MNKLKYYIPFIFSLAALVISIGHAMLNSESKKIAYVRSSELVYDYLGMQEAQRNYREKTEAWQANIDTLKNDFQVTLSKYQSDYAALKKEDREVREKLLGQQEENLRNYTMAINEKAREEDEKITQAVLNQINSFVEEYGKANGYDVILGTTVSGNLLYGKKTMDITGEVLLALNKKYKGE